MITCVESRALKKPQNIDGNLTNICTKNYAKSSSCIGSRAFQIFRSSALLSKILFSEFGTQGFSEASEKGSRLEIQWPIFIIFGWKVYETRKFFEMQIWLDSTNIYQDINGVAFLLDSTSYTLLISKPMQKFQILRK